MALLLEGAALGFSAAAQPGPYQAYLLAQSARNGAARTLPVALTPLVADPPLVAAVLLVLSQVPAGFVRALGTAGGALVVWLGIGALRAASAGARPAQAPPPPAGFVRGVLVNLTSPGAWLFWSLVGGPILTTAWRAAPSGATAFLVGFYALLVGGNALIVLVAGRIARSGPRAARLLGVISGIALVAFGLWRVASGLLVA